MIVAGYLLQMQDIQSQRAAQKGTSNPQVAAVQLVKALALVQLGDNQRAQQELAAAFLTLSNSNSPQQQPEAQQESLQHVQQMYERVSRHIADVA